jgi:hypothetical protein
MRLCDSAKWLTILLLGATACNTRSVPADGDAASSTCPCRDIDNKVVGAWRNNDREAGLTRTWTFAPNQRFEATQIFSKTGTIVHSSGSWSVHDGELWTTVEQSSDPNLGMRVGRIDHARYHREGGSLVWGATKYEGTRGAQGASPQ